MAPGDIHAYLKNRQELIDRTLDRLLPGKTEFPGQLHAAMRYCLFAGGKRLRPILALAAAEAIGYNSHMILPEACALEMIHTYSLIHDDLPSMDNDDYRRGCLTTHRVFGEAIAILAGDALLTEAFKVLAGSSNSGAHRPDKSMEIVRLVADACGSQGVIGGQVIDLESEGKLIDKELLDYIHTNKTGRLITASVKLGAILAGATAEQLERLGAYGRAIGLAFQVTDDILNVIGSTVDLGKATGSDSKRGKATYPGLLGMEEARRTQELLYQESIAALLPFGQSAEPLRAIAKIIIERDR